jgi:NitT/TauT family transport system permease protein
LGRFEGMKRDGDATDGLQIGRQDHGRRPVLALLPRASSLASLVGLCLVWSMVAGLWPNRALPPPMDVWRVMVAELMSGDLLYHLTMTLSRVAAAYVIAMALGTVIGVVLGRSRRLDHFFDPWLVLLLNIPALVIIILAYIWFGLTEAAAVGAVAVNKIPNVVVTMREGARSLDDRFMEMAQIYRLTALDRIRHILVPQLQPYFAAASRSGIALIWKIVLVVELLGRSNGVGFQINLYFQIFDVAGILAYTLAFVAIMLMIEVFLVQPLEHHATRWRRRAA